MKIEHIHKLILKFIGGGIVNFPTRFLKWIKVESCDCDGGDDDGDDSGDDSQSGINLNDFADFNISVLVDEYYNYSVEDIIPLNELLNVTSVDVLNALTSLSSNGGGDAQPNINFYDYNNTENGHYNHNIVIYPNRLNDDDSGFNIEITTTKTYTEDDTPLSSEYRISLLFNGETLEVIDINGGGK